jgi:hypothetical protein
MGRKKPPKRIVCGPIRCCIYCGASDVELSDEHIVPAGLNGTWTIPEASCGSCSKITGELERLVLRGNLLGPRVSLGFFTRDPTDRPKSLLLRIDNQEHDVPADQHPVNLMLLEFVPAGIWAGTIYGPGVHLTGYAAYSSRDRIENLVRPRVPNPLLRVKQPAARISISQPYDYKAGELEAFLRMLAKIGYCAVVAKAGIHRIQGGWIQRVILGNYSHIHHFVGSVPQNMPLSELPPAVTRPESSHSPDKPHEFHRVTVDQNRGFWHAYIQLFRHFFAGNPPIYHVVVGEVARQAADQSPRICAQHPTG